jgi:N6-adenosine-specific RNA methylase IME4
MSTDVALTTPRLEAIAVEIERLQSGAAFAIAAKLAEAREIFRYRRDEGGFRGWVEHRLNRSFSLRTAYNLLDVHERFGTAAESVQILHTLPRSALYELAAPSTPEAAREEFIERAEAGEALKFDDVRQIIAAHGEGPVLRAAKMLRAERTEVRRTERLQQIVEIAKGNTALSTTVRYPIVLADPPWFFETYTSEVAHERAPPYPPMTIEEICALLVGDLATAAAMLFLWVTSAHLEHAFTVMKAWGFEYSTSMVWVKTACAPGLGHIARQQHEHLLVGRRGDFPAPPPSTRPSSAIMAPRREHSRKPDEAYEIIERMYPGLPRVELFARRRRPGWDAWGNQVEPAEAAE